jgi:hypothetical protein
MKNEKNKIIIGDDSTWCWHFSKRAAKRTRP